MNHAIRIHETGGPEVLSWEEVDLPDPAVGEIQLQHTAIGLNLIDIYFRTGLYPATLPTTIGMEAAGMVTATGEGVEHIKAGDRVAYPMVQGAYAEQRNVAAEKVVVLPDSISDDQAAGMMLKGLTAQYLLRRTYRVQPGDTILVYAAAGGVGSLLCPWAKQIGAAVIACVGSEEKAAQARANGCDHTILYDRENVPERVRDITNGEGVAVSYDSIGNATFMDSLDSLRPFGMMVTYGNASGKVEAFEPGVLAVKGSLYVTRPTLANHVATRQLLEDGASELFEVVASGAVQIAINQRFDLRDVASAHQALENRQTTGSTILLP